MEKKRPHLVIIPPELKSQILAEGKKDMRKICDMTRVLIVEALRARNAK